MRKGKNLKQKDFQIILGEFIVLISIIFVIIFTRYSIQNQNKNKSEETVSGEELVVTVTETVTEAVNDEIDIKENDGNSISSDTQSNDVTFTEEPVIENIVLEKPINRTADEVLEHLRELSESYPKIKSILEEQVKYPEEMLEALANNPEMTDFVIGYRSNEQVVTGGLTDAEKNTEYPLFLQWDSRWGYAPYGDNSNIGLCGCGPSCLSMVLYYKTRNASLTPDVLASYAMAHGYYVSEAGTSWSFMKDVAAQYGIQCKYLDKSEGSIKAELDNGNFIICAMAPGDFTAEGHFIVIYNYDEEGFFVNDPNSKSRSTKKWTYVEISNQIKKIWVY